MKRETEAARAMNDADLKARRRDLAKDIPRLQAELDAIDRERRRRTQLAKAADQRSHP